MHDSGARYDAPKCHPNTRLAVLEHIMTWVFGSNDRNALILWLYGPAGAGKSAIMQSISEQCEALNLLLASFFFSRYDTTRDHAGSLVATIAYQISTRIPQISPALDAAISRDPLVFDKTLDAQIDVLVVRPLKYLTHSGYFEEYKSPPLLILIDGLDECNQKDHRQHILQAIARALRKNDLPIMFLISSRPETDIRFSFNSKDLVGLWDSIALGDTYEADDDIRLFLNDSFREIKETHPLKEHIPFAWPTLSVLDRLVAKSSGQFIYASVVVKYISTLDTPPPRQLDIILGVRAAHRGDIPFAEMDALYMHILSSVQDTQLMLDILALLMGYFDFRETWRPSDTSRFLGVDQEDVEIIFSSLASITARSKFRKTNHERRVYISHASLSDFLAYRNRSGRFHIDRALYTARLAHKGIKFLCSKRGVSRSFSQLPKKAALEFVEIFEAVAASPRPLQMSEDLYKDLKSLPLDLVWHNLLVLEPMSRRLFDWSPLEKIFEWLQPKSKALDIDTSIQADRRYRELHIHYARCLKPLVKKAYNQYFPLKYFPILMETLAHNFDLNGTCYDKAITTVLENWVPKDEPWNFSQKSELSLPCTIFKTIGQSGPKFDENPYIHAALQILRSLETGPSPNFMAAAHYPTHLFTGMRRLWAEDYRNRQSSKFAEQQKRNNINSGRIYKLQRELRLRKLQFGLRSRSKESYASLSWNRELVSKFLIPILDICPKSEKLMGSIDRRIGHIFLSYTTRRRLVCAIDTYKLRQWPTF
ncbi:hypothetical protein HYPSUDRAFT_44369 [Hypholoma sublateritium FD-334 SS-4]|uniref:Nephrocystin 3-like N-terminal domain-containing protein n=1 Tax=Hypholoma sublateritium (strain FD-334 SS-4) TaxID=945553 RepID=A0A0D2KXQ5_HYPSF|nr:hypothetical protein HYPSUDRAFT_44369 [Hypholoma sublateritium FD-334 SS-4]